MWYLVVVDVWEEEVVVVVVVVVVMGDLRRWRTVVRRTGA